MIRRTIYCVMEYIKIKDLVLLEQNPRKITETQFKKLCKSLDEDPEFFDARPCLVNLDRGVMTVYAGNQRVRAAEKLGWESVPCIIHHDLTEEQMKSRVIKDNKSFGEWDFDILAGSYEIELLLESGFTQFELGLDSISPGDDELPEKKEKKKKQCPECGHEF